MSMDANASPSGTLPSAPTFMTICTSIPAINTRVPPTNTLVPQAGAPDGCFTFEEYYMAISLGNKRQSSSVGMMCLITISFSPHLEFLTESSARPSVFMQQDPLPFIGWK